MTAESSDRVIASAADGGQMLQVKEIHKGFGQLQVLRGVNLDVDRGQVVCVIGPSGSGKSTLLRCINLLEPLDEGRILLEGREITGKTTAEDRNYVRQRVGIVFQQYNLFPHKTALENVSLAQEKVLERNRDEARGKGRGAAHTGWASRTRSTSTPSASPAASSSGWRSRGPWPWTRT